MDPQTIYRSYTVPSPARLTIRNLRGTVDLQGGAFNQVSVKAVLHPDSGDAQRTRIELSQSDDGSVVVAVHFERAARILGGGHPCRVDLQLQVPRACLLDVSCGSSATRVRTLAGQVALKSVSGKVTARDLSGSLTLETVSGDFHGERLFGLARLETVSGNLLLEDSHLEGVQASAVSGRLTMDGALGIGPYRFESVSGDVRLLLPPDTGCKVDYHSLSGRFKTSLPITANQRAGRNWLGAIQGGGPRVSHSSVSGDLWIGTRAVDVSTPVLDEPGPGRLEILDQVERGQLSVADALAALSPSASAD